MSSRGSLSPASMARGGLIDGPAGASSMLQCGAAAAPVRIPVRACRCCRPTIRLGSRGGVQGPGAPPVSFRFRLLWPWSRGLPSFLAPPHRAGKSGMSRTSGDWSAPGPICRCHASEGRRARRYRHGLAGQTNGDLSPLLCPSCTPRGAQAGQKNFWLRTYVTVLINY